MGADQVKEVVELALSIQAEAAKRHLNVEARACVMAASNLMLAEAIKPAKK